MSSPTIYILLGQVNFFVTKKRYVNACLANFAILNVKFPSLLKFKHPDSVETLKENKNCSLVGEESFLLFRTNYDFILTTKNNFLPFI